MWNVIDNTITTTFNHATGTNNEQIFDSAGGVFVFCVRPPSGGIFSSSGDVPSYLFCASLSTLPDFPRGGEIFLKNSIKNTKFILRCK